MYSENSDVTKRTLWITAQSRAMLYSRIRRGLHLKTAFSPQEKRKSKWATKHKWHLEHKLFAPPMKLMSPSHAQLCRLGYHVLLLGSLENHEPWLSPICLSARVIIKAHYSSLVPCYRPTVSDLPRCSSLLQWGTANALQKWWETLWVQEVQ